MINSYLSGGFLQHTLYPPANFAPQVFTLDNGVEVKHHDIGVVEISPPNPTKDIVISSGIHGDETAPIELVDNLVKDIVEGLFVPKERTLFIIAHPTAIHAYTRFIEENLNRLFAGENDHRNAECVLANRLQCHVKNFFTLSTMNTGETSRERWHFDLHSAIRDSKHYMFAVIPASSHATDIRPLASFLQCAEMDAMLLSRTPSSTFSWWSGEKFGALAATFEMGRVAPLYKNDMTEFEPLKQGLIALLSHKTYDASANSKSFDIYKVSRTITKTDDAFTLAFSNDAANFTFFNEGEALAEENGKEYVSEVGGEAVVFPNANVAVGQRACLLVKPFSPDFSRPLYVNVERDPGPIAAS
ncbi:succinylglutamate desuccinylase [Enterovibrio baiacu]|uniref:succinylglutamate desuccinylase n=1 Tax=Enterovibrio baiacu TaxID=2491023 RepID=UPI003D152261